MTPGAWGGFQNWPTKTGSTPKRYLFQVLDIIMVGISQVELYERVGKSVIAVCERS